MREEEGVKDGQDISAKGMEHDPVEHNNSKSKRSSNNYAGIEVREDDLRDGRYMSIRYSARFRYRWDTGIAVGRFLEGLRNGRIVGSRCKVCKRVLVPPRIFCELDFAQVDEWVYVGDTGSVNTYSISYIDKQARRISNPVIVAVIELDGASQGMGIMHLLGEVRPEDVHIGMRVKAVWKSREERRGAITDIMYFKPL
ncbi:MAG: Zn-ribbon domain-containing OB-fold protein [Candidatus Nitrosocaldus sp.]